MTPVAFDTLTAARALGSAGFEPRRAEAIAPVMRAAALKGRIDRPGAAPDRKIDRPAEEISGLKNELAATGERLPPSRRNIAAKADLAAMERRIHRAFPLFGGSIVAAAVGVAGMAAAFAAPALRAG